MSAVRLDSVHEVDRSNQCARGGQVKSVCAAMTPFCQHSLLALTMPGTVINTEEKTAKYTALYASC